MSEQAPLFRGGVSVIVRVGDTSFAEIKIEPCSAKQFSRLLHYIELGCSAPSRRNRRVKRKET